MRSLPVSNGRSVNLNRKFSATAIACGRVFSSSRRANSSPPSAGVERLDQAALVVLARHHQDVDRAPAGGEQPRLPAQLDPGNVLELGAGNKRLDAGVGPNLDECFELIGKRNDLMAACFKHAADDQLVVRLGSTRAMRIQAAI
jgi:hypothetical protein